LWHFFEVVAVVAIADVALILVVRSVACCYFNLKQNPETLHIKSNLSNYHLGYQM